MNHRQLLRRAVLLGALLSLFFQSASITSITRANREPLATKRPFRMLVLGDSVMWGQGLLDDHKFSYRVREWICQQRNNGRCPDQNDVQIHVEAHSRRSGTPVKSTTPIPLSGARLSWLAASIRKAQFHSMRST